MNRTEVAKILLEIQEAVYTYHALDRIEDRIKVFNYEDIPFYILKQVYDGIEKIRSIKFPINKTYAIKLGFFKPKKSSRFYHNDDRFNTPVYKVEVDDEKNKPSESKGNQIWAIIVKNTVTTIMLRNSEQSFPKADKIIHNLQNYYEMYKKYNS